MLKYNCLISAYQTNNYISEIPRFDAKVLYDYGLRFAGISWLNTHLIFDAEPTFDNVTIKEEGGGDENTQNIPEVCHFSDAIFYLFMVW